jgi:hypothetical protein
MAHISNKGVSVSIAPRGAAFYATRPIRVVAVRTDTSATISSGTIRSVVPQRERVAGPFPVGLSTTPVAGRRFYAQGVVKVGGLPCRRLVRVRRRDSGELLVEGNSEALGQFCLSWAEYSGPIEVSIYDDATQATPYNAKIFDLVVVS